MTLYLGSAANLPTSVVQNFKKRELLVSWDGEEVRTVSRDEFLAANAEDAFVSHAVGALRPGESVSLGGGAAPMLVVVAL